MGGPLRSRTKRIKFIIATRTQTDTIPDQGVVLSAKVRVPICFAQSCSREPMLVLKYRLMCDLCSSVNTSTPVDCRSATLGWMMRCCWCWCRAVIVDRFAPVKSVVCLIAVSHLSAWHANIKWLLCRFRNSPSCSDCRSYRDRFPRKCARVCDFNVRSSSQHTANTNIHIYTHTH